MESKNLMLPVLLTYGVMAMIGTGIAWYNDRITTLFQGQLVGLDWPAVLAAAVILVLILLMVSEVLRFFFKSYDAFSEEVFEIFKGRSFLTYFFLAASSAFAEETFFRGGLQPELGLIPTSILFGLMHLDPRRGIGVWSLWTAFAGYLMGYIYQQTENLWVPIGIHFCVNFYSFTRIYIASKTDSKSDQTRKIE